MKTYQAFCQINENNTTLHLVEVRAKNIKEARVKIKASCVKHEPVYLVK